MAHCRLSSLEKLFGPFTGGFLQLSVLYGQCSITPLKIVAWKAANGEVILSCVATQLTDDIHADDLQIPINRTHSLETFRSDIPPQAEYRSWIKCQRSTWRTMLSSSKVDTRGSLVIARRRVEFATVQRVFTCVK